MAPNAALPLPAMVVVENARGCNLACPMCAVHQSGATQDRRVMDPALGDRLVAEGLGVGTRLGLSVSAEPLLDPALGDWIRRAEDVGARLRIVTNGTVLPTELDRLVAVSDVILFSVDSPDPDVFREVRGGASLERVIRTIRAFVTAARAVSKPPWLGLSAVVSDRTLDDLPELVDLAGALGLDRVGVAHLSVFDEDMAAWSLRGQPERVGRVFAEAGLRARRHHIHLALPPGMDGLAPAPQGRRQQLVDLGRRARRLRADRVAATMRRRLAQRRGGLDRVPCVYLRERLYVDLDGQARPCCMPGVAVVGDLRRQSVAEVWQGGPLRALREALAEGRATGPCAHCSVNTGPRYDPRDPRTEAPLSAPPATRSPGR